MIFNVSISFLQKCKLADISDFACDIAKYGHYLKVDKESFRIIKTAVREHGSTNQKECFASHTEIFDLSNNLSDWIRQIDIDVAVSLEAFKYLISEPARLITENANNEWPVYKHFIDIYKSDPNFGDVFTILKRAKDKKHVIGVQAGGCGELIKTADNDPVIHNGINLRLLKTLILFDRDTTDNLSFDGYKNPLFRRLAGKTHITIQDGDIFTLNQGDPVWHMWYKRAIENYFPDSQYQQADFDTSAISNLTPQQRDYALLGGNNSNPPLIKGYDKSSLPNLLNGLSRAKLEKHLKRFVIGGREYSEIQLFLLKLSKTI